MQIDTVANNSPTATSGRVARQVAGMNDIEVKATITQIDAALAKRRHLERNLEV